MKTLYKLLVTAIPFLAPYPTWVKLFVLGGLSAIVLITLTIVTVLVLTYPRSPENEDAGNLVLNGSFESGFAHWGSGYVEDLIHNGNFPPQPLSPWVVQNAQSTCTVDATEHHGTGIASLRIVHASRRSDQSWGTLSQRITGLRRHTFYLITFWAKVRSSDASAVFMTADLKWEPNYAIPPGQTDWQQHRFAFNTGDNDSIDLRFVAQAPAHLWIDDVRMVVQTAQQ